ncbi:hypothetical protein ACIGFK_13080 [Streptomyces sp. NPDC085524]|uniref:hypothetical protein n=1 Tax=Streptomyces sp. NPDC085524 TaxID=3365728 RepID=UPI0037CD1282
MSRTQIGLAAGVSTAIVAKIARSVSPKLNRTTADKILAVSPCVVRPSDLVPAIGTRRRLQALYAIGHGAQAIETATGLTGSSIRRILYVRSDIVTAATHDAVKRGYRTLCASPGRNQTVRNRGRRNGWPGPAAWGEDIDDPAAAPDLDDLIAERPAGKREEVEHLLRSGEPQTAVQLRTGASQSYVRQIAAELEGRPRIRTAAAA